ncbi:hypothetical protein PC128_g9435 [Phytophthora cactorum]|nr:hypothetical protein PC128_g9435 [Phytophthora cactorum]
MTPSGMTPREKEFLVEHLHNLQRTIRECVARLDSIGTRQENLEHAFPNAIRDKTAKIEGKLDGASGLQALKDIETDNPLDDLIAFPELIEGVATSKTTPKEAPGEISSNEVASKGKAKKPEKKRKLPETDSSKKVKTGFRSISDSASASSASEE